MTSQRQMTHTMTVDVFIMSHDEMANPNAAVSRKIFSLLAQKPLCRFLVQYLV